MGGQGRTGVAGYRISGQGIAHRELRNSMAANRERERYVFLRSTEKDLTIVPSLSFCQERLLKESVDMLLT